MQDGRVVARIALSLALSLALPLALYGRSRCVALPLMKVASIAAGVTAGIVAVVWYGGV